MRQNVECHSVSTHVNMWWWNRAYKLPRRLYCSVEKMGNLCVCALLNSAVEWSARNCMESTLPKHFFPPFFSEERFIRMRSRWVSVANANSPFHMWQLAIIKIKPQTRTSGPLLLHQNSTECDLKLFDSNVSGAWSSLGRYLSSLVQREKKCITRCYDGSVWGARGEVSDTKK